MEANEGEIIRSRGLTVGHVEQDVPEALMDTPFYAAVLEALSVEQRLSERWRVDVALESLEVPETLRQKPLKHLSGGWQRLAMLARVLMTEADVLLLDEPTNHLDLARIGQLENWMNALPREMPVVISSHDRAFLDATTNRTLFLRPEASQIFSLPYTRARAALREADASDQRRYQHDLKTAQQLRQTLQIVCNSNPPFRPINAVLAFPLDFNGYLVQGVSDQPPQTLEGEQVNAQFGTSVASVGDINRGAPTRMSSNSPRSRRDLSTR